MSVMGVRESNLYSSSYITDVNSSNLDLNNARGYCIEAVNTVANSTARTFLDADVDVTENSITLDAAHGWLTGRKVTASTNGVLPAGLSATTYYIIVVSASVVKLADSLAHAQAGTAVDITAAAGGGTHTLTPAAIAGGTMLLSASNDGTNWFTLSGTSTNVTATANILWNVDAPYYRYVRVAAALSAGQVSSVVSARALYYGRP